MIKNLAHMVFEGLAYLHRSGVVFGDMSAGNLVFNEFNMLKYADFGNARLVLDAEDSRGAVGRRELWAPELWGKGESGSASKKRKKERLGSFKKEKGAGNSGTLDPTYQSDLWGVGCLLYQMGTGRLPFKGDNLRKQVIEDDSPELEGVSEELADLVAKLLVKSPTERIFWNEIIEHDWVKSFDHTLETGNLKDIPRVEPVVPDYLRTDSNVDTIKKGVFELKKELGSNGSESEIDPNEDEEPSSPKGQRPSSTPEKSDKHEIAEIESSMLVDNKELSESRLFKAEDLRAAAQEEVELPSFKKKAPKGVSARGKGIPDHMRDSIALDDKIFSQRVEGILQLLRGSMLVTKKDRVIEQIIFNPRIEKIVLPRISEQLVDSFPISLFSDSDNSANISRFLDQMLEMISGGSLPQPKLLSILVYLTRLCSFKEVANALTEHPLMDHLLASLEGQKARRVKSSICTLVANALKNKVSLNPDFYQQTQFDRLYRTFKSSSCPTVRARALACIGEYMFFCSTQDLSDSDAGDFEASWNRSSLIEKMEKGVDLLRNLKKHGGHLDLSSFDLSSSAVLQHDSRNYSPSDGHFQMPSKASDLLLGQLEQSIRAKGPDRLYVLKSLQNIITLSKSNAKRIAHKRRAFGVLRNLIVFGGKTTPARGWATFCLLNLLYAELETRVEFSGLLEPARLHMAKGVYHILDLLEEDPGKQFQSTETLIKCLISDFKDRDEQVRLASMSLLLFIFANIHRLFFENIEEKDMSKLIRDLASIYEHASTRVKTKCLGIITIFVMRDFKALYHMLENSKLLTCFDRDISKIEAKTVAVYEKTRFEGDFILLIYYLFKKLKFLHGVMFLSINIE